MKRFFIIILCFLTFTTCKKNKDQVINPPIPPTPKVPVVRTDPVTNISLFSATFSGKLVDTGGSKVSELGFVVDTIPNPTTTRNFKKFVKQADSNGEFNSIVTNVPPDKAWYVKAYAINSQGIGYGNEVNFRSPSEKAFSGEVYLTNQQEVNNFGANNYTTIHGSLHISGPITDLSPLQSLVIIGNGCEIVNTQISNFSGLENIEIIGNDFINSFRIEYNHSLTNMHGFTKLRIVNGNFYIYNNNGLVSLNGLDNLTTISWDFEIINCNNLTSITGLEKMLFIFGDIRISNNPLLSNLEAWSNLSLVKGRIYFNNNSSLQKINCFEKLKKIETIEITNNPILNDISGFRNLDTITYAILIDNNNSLTNIAAFSNITNTEIVRITRNNSIQDLEGLKNLQTVKDDVDIENNPALTNLQGLRRLKSARRLIIGTLNALTNLSGLDSLTSLTSIFPAQLSIGGNAQLQNLDGLKNLRRLDGSIGIFNNPVLSNFCGLKPLLLTGWNNSYNVQANAINPTPSQIVNGCP